MRLRLIALLCVAALSTAGARAERIVSRSALDGAKPVVQCKLQALSAPAENYMPQQAVIYSLQPPPEDPLANYERTPLGDWPMPATVDRNDPWLRVLLVGPKRPLVIDLAVFIDGRPFRESREAWIDELLAARETGPVVDESAAAETTADTAANEENRGGGNSAAASAGTNPSEAASQVGSADDEASDAKFEASAKTSEPANSADKQVTAEAAAAELTTDDTETEAKTKTSGDEPAADVDENSAAPADEDSETEDSEPAVPTVTAERRRAPTMRERLISYLAAAGADADREEIRWLIAEWGSGPAALQLGPSLSWQRAGLAPLLAYLDQDDDGGLSAAEIASAAELLRRADMDANDVLDLAEIRRAAKRPAATPFATGHSMLVALDSETDWNLLAATLNAVYGTTGSALPTDADGLQELRNQPADVTLRVDFGPPEKAGEKNENKKDPDQTSSTGVSVLAVSEKLGSASEVVTATADVVTLDLGADYVEFSAAQRSPLQRRPGDYSPAAAATPRVASPSAAEGITEIAATQVAVGAAIDGNPLLRLLDRDNDRRLTRRERQELTGLLSALDRDGDGAVGTSEMPMPIRFAVTLGPQVHQLLAEPVGAAKAIAPREKAPAAPAWFSSMDKNGDGDLSRGEFLGTTDQFRQFDADGDGLLSIAEALKLNPGQ